MSTLFAKLLFEKVNQLEQTFAWLKINAICKVSFVLTPAIIDVIFYRSGKLDTSKWTSTWLTSVRRVNHTPLSRAVQLFVIGSPLRDKRSVYWFW